MKYYFPIHFDGGNRGCEAIAKGTAIILQEKKENLVGLCTDAGLDIRLGVDKHITLIPTRKKSFFFEFFLRLYRKITRNNEKCNAISYKYVYTSFINRMNHDDVLVSTGGDMMCYGNNEVNYTVNLAKEKGIKSILWGCSIGEENLTKEKLEALHNFSLIYARESMTKDMLAKHGINKVVVYPDPAFILKPEQCELPKCFSKENVIGINLSNLVLGGYGLDTPFAKEILNLFEYIISKTDDHILLVPHVFWNGQDDRIVCNAIKEKFPTSRVSVFDSEKLNYCQIRYVISHCKMFIGARTHAVISAYSMCVPTIALGYSVKSVGIAKDLNLPDWTVVDSKKNITDALLNSFLKLQTEYAKISSILSNQMKEYSQKPMEMHSVISKFN